MKSKHGQETHDSPKSKRRTRAKNGQTIAQRWRKYAAHFTQHRCKTKGRAGDRLLTGRLPPPLQDAQ